MLAVTETPTALPDMKVSVRQVFGIDSDLEVPPSPTRGARAGP